ncbi:hypothetical protein BPAE_0239g00170 [Botrytis paeoniae]|uniref:Uncharacterized protein n=1 Tax=Botrytis paeoniae TaxID=278948 RepID=A0A4Z1FCS2_9HELO|nr:hypothetical protein BPAE_0239g00170 [Botrytis paeoniae]
MPDRPPSSEVYQAQQPAKEPCCPSGNKSSYKAAKIALARKATHYLSGSQTTMPQMLFDALWLNQRIGQCNLPKQWAKRQQCNAMQHQAAKWL